MASKTWKEQVDRGVELLKLCQRLQSATDGVDRPEPFVFVPAKIIRQRRSRTSVLSTASPDQGNDHDSYRRERSPYCHTGEIARPWYLALASQCMAPHHLLLTRGNESWVL